MAKLKLECLDRKIKWRKLAKAVYKTLGQTARFKAEIVFQDGESMAYLNRTTRGVDSVTDVLSYPSMEGIKGKILRIEECKTELEGKYIFLGSIVLCDDKIRAQAEEFGLRTSLQMQISLSSGWMITSAGKNCWLIMSIILASASAMIFPIF